MSVKKSDRARVVDQHWVRDPEGKPLEDPPPKGARPPNNIIWGHTLKDFYRIPCIPGSDDHAIWSRSMIKEYGENYLKEEHSEEPAPRRLRPWPCLTLPDHLAASAALGYIDEGCDSMHGRPMRRVQDDVVQATKSTDHASDVGSPAPASIVPVSPADVKMSDNGDPATTALSQDPGLIVDGAAATACVAEVPKAPASAAPDAPAADSMEVATPKVDNASEEKLSDAAPDAPAASADSMEVDIPKVEDNTREEERLSDAMDTVYAAAAPDALAADSMEVDIPKVEDSASGEEKKLNDAMDIVCAADPVPEAAAQVAVADTTTVAGSPKIDGDAGDEIKPGDGAADMNVDGAEAKNCVDESCGDEIKPSDGAVDLNVDGPGAEVKKCVDKSCGGADAKALEATDVSETNDAVTSAKDDSKLLDTAASQPVATSGPVKPVTASPTEPAAAPAVSEAPIVSPPPPPPTPEPPIFHNLPKLEEFIPEEYFPDILYVNDPDHITMKYSIRGGSRTQEPVPRKYKRVWPRFARDTEPATALNTDLNCASIKFPTPPSATAPPPPPSSATSPPTVPEHETNLRIAHLNLSYAPRLGVGNHSVVHRAALRLPHPLAARSPTGEVTVAAKAGFRSEEARPLLLNEGKIYDAFPKHLQEGWCGLNLVAPILHPVPVGPVVPKFYGYYVPVREDVEEAKQEAVRDWMEKKKAARQKEKEEWLEEKRSRAEARELRKAAKAEKAARAATDSQDVEFKASDALESQNVGEADGKPSPSALKTEAQEPTADDSTAVGDGGEPSTKAAAVDSSAKNEEQELEDEIDDDNDEDDDSDEEDEADEAEAEAEAMENDEREGFHRFGNGAIYDSWYQMSPLLLLEECGAPIVPSKFTADERSECYSLALRLHHAEFTQNSFYVRNILRQPGPLTVAPSARSDSTPSFRIIDFGRGEHLPYQQEAAKKKNEFRRRYKAKIGMGVPTKREMKKRVADDEAWEQGEKMHLEYAQERWRESRDYEVHKAHRELQIVRDVDS